MLEGIEEIDWSQLSHAYGPAVDVPSHLRALTSEDEAERSEALDQLQSTIWHQGSVYEATAAAVPFLLQIAECSLPPWRRQIVSFLGQIAWSSTYDNWFLTWGSQRRRESHEIRDVKVRDVECKRAIRARLAEKWDFFVRLSESPDERFTGLSVLAILLEHFDELPIELEPAAVRIVHRWDERLDIAVGRQEFALALGRAAGGRGDALSVLRRRFAAEQDRNVKTAIAVALFDAAELDDRDCQLLLDAARNVQLREKFWAWEVSLGPRIARFKAAVIERNLGAIAEIIRNTNGLDVERIVKPLLPLFFGPLAEKPTDWQRTPEQISDAQATIIQAIADNNAYWRSFGNAHLPLLCYGLPLSRQALRRLIARPGRDVSPRNDSGRAVEIFRRHVQLQMPRRKDAPPPPQPSTTNASRTIAAAIDDVLRFREPSNDPALVTKMHLVGEADDALAALLPLCANLATLDLTSGLVSDVGVAHLARLLQLTTLSLSDCLISDHGLEFLQDLHRLQELNLSKCQINGSGFRPLTGLMSLCRLILADTNFQDEHFAHLESFVRVRVLSLAGTPITGKGFSYLRNWRDVEELYLNQCPQLTDAFLPHIRAFHRLQKLYCAKSPKIRRQLECLAEMQSLQVLDFDGTGIDDQGLAQLPRLSALSELRLSGTEVTAAGLANLARNRSIKKLNLAATKPTTAVLDALACVEALEALDLSNASVTDAALQGLGQFPSLRTLNLSATKITDAAVPHLLELVAPKWINFEQTAVSDQAIAMLREGFPETTIVV